MGGVLIHNEIQDDGFFARLAMSDRVIQEEAKAKLKTAAFALNKLIKEDMPVDTGRARASWGVWSPGLERENPDAKPSDAVFRVSADGNTITQGTNVPYVEDLNDGSSTQAPSGFIDRDAEIASDELVIAIDDLISGYFF